MLVIALLAQLAAGTGGGARVQPVLAFPEVGMDDSASYAGYKPRFYKDVAGNTLQLYLDQRSGRVVNLWADSDNESLGFSTKSTRGSPEQVTWDSPEAVISGTPTHRVVEYTLTASDP